MGITEVTRKFRIDAGHRLKNHKGKCQHLHGHSYEFVCTFTSDEIDEDGMVVDFGILKASIGKWLDENWDHTLLLQRGDLLLPTLFMTGERVCVLDVPPTAENLAKLFAQKVQELLRDLCELRLLSVRVYETPNCWAEYIV